MPIQLATFTAGNKKSMASAFATVKYGEKGVDSSFTKLGAGITIGATILFFSGFRGILIDIR